MPNNERTWQAIEEDVIEGKHADKRVEHTDFSTIRRMRLDQRGDGYTTISYKLAGMWFGQSVFENTTYQTLEIPGAGHIEPEGAPELPQEGIFVAIPENAEITDVTYSEPTEEAIITQHLQYPRSTCLAAGEGNGRTAVHPR